VIRDESNFSVEVEGKEGEVEIAVVEYECLHPCLMAVLRFHPENAVKLALEILEAAYKTA